MEQIHILNLAKRELIHEISDLEIRQENYLAKYGHENDNINQNILNKHKELNVIYELILNERKK